MVSARELMFSFLFVVAAACGGGGGGGLNIPARVPVGSGQTSINMVGMWVIQNVRLIETNSPAVSLPRTSAIVSMASNGIVAVDGQLVSRQEIELLLGVPLNWYVNTADGRTMMFGYSASIPTTGEFITQALAGGALGANRIEVECYTEGRASAQDPLLFVRCRYSLLRVQGSPLNLSEPGETGRAALSSAFPALTPDHEGEQSTSTPSDEPSDEEGQPSRSLAQIRHEG